MTAEDDPTKTEYTPPEPPIVNRRRSLDLSGRTAIVTGASRGIGEEIALTLARAGADVAVTARDEKSLESVADMISAEGRRAIIFAGDIADPKTSIDLAKKVKDEWGRIDITVNNAGISHAGDLLRVREEDIDKVLATNLKGTIYTTKAVLRYMIGQKGGESGEAYGGSIINMSSVSPAVGQEGEDIYNAAKAGIEGFTRSVARRYAVRGIRANIIAPGAIYTDMILEADKKFPGIIDRFVSQTPLGRVGLTEEVADTTLWLASDMSSYVNGQRINVNGGMYFS